MFTTNNDAERNFLLGELGVTEGDLNTLRLRWLEIETGLTGTLQDLSRVYWEGVTGHTGNVPDLEYEFFRTIYTHGTLNDMRYQYYASGGVIPNPLFIATVLQATGVLTASEVLPA